MRLFIEPIDVWLFRDGRPFDAGSDHRAASLFPPPPSVIQGALRAAHLAFRGVKMDDYVNRNLPQAEREQIEGEIGSPDAGPPDKPLPFTLRGPFVARRNEDGTITRYLPLPADATRVTGGYRALAPIDEPGVHTNLPEGKLLWQSNREPVGSETPEQAEKHYAGATSEAVSRYLAEQQPISVSSTVAESDLFERESRLGIGLDYSVRRPAEGALYEAEFIRARPDVGIEVQVDKLNGWPKKGGLLKLGGEGHAGRFEVLDDDVPPTLMPMSPDSRKPVSVGEALGIKAPSSEVVCFKLYFATPTYFSDGWKPQTWEAIFEKPAPQLVAAALSRFESRGGFDLYRETQKQLAHKPALRYVPAGSVYYFEGSASTQLIRSNVTEYGAEIGFGQVIIGRW